MGRLIKWFNMIIKKQKGVKRWQKVVTVMAAMITFATTYALILPAITVEKNSTEEVGGMYLEQTAEQDELLEENALEPTGVSIAADMDNAVTFACANDDLTATAVFSTDEIIPEGTELVVSIVDPASEEYAAFRGRSEGLLDKEFIYDVTTCSFYDFALVCDNVDVTPKTGLVDIQIIFRNNTNQHVNDVIYAGRFARQSEDADRFVAMAVSTAEAEAEADDTVSMNGTAVNDNSAGESGDPSAGEDELVSLNIDESSVIELSDGIITSLSLKGSDLSRSDSLVGIIAGYVDEEIKAAAAETDAEVPEYDESQDEDAPRSSGEDASGNADNNVSTSPEENSSGTSAEDERKEITDALQMKTLKASGKDYTVTLTYDESSKIPEGASLTVSEISKDSKEYQTYLEETKKAMGLKEEETLPGFAARFFDIKIMVGGKEFNPESGVSVEITYTEPLAEYSDTEVNAVHFADEKAEAEMIEANTAEVQDDGKATVEFTAESFSVYGVIYTVDFHWEVNGKTYAFSIPGGGFVSFYDLVEVLGIANSDISSESGAKSAEKGADSTLQDGVEESDISNSGTYSAADLNAMEISEETRKFVADIERVEFSNSDLVWVGKTDSDSTVEWLKHVNHLECEYSADLTEEQIADINAQTVEAGDWALISMQPFTSEESLTVTMKNEEQFVVKVTDAQISTHVITADGQDYMITVIYGPEAGIPDGAELEAEEIAGGTAAYDSYLSQALIELYGTDADDADAILHHSVEYARFFDISILADGVEIEPEAPVSVQIEYMGTMIGDSGDMNVVHFAEYGPEVLAASTSVGEDRTDILFEQGSFSVTGTIVNNTNITPGEDYYIVHKEGQNWYALATDGSYVNVTSYYNDSSSSISGYNEPKNISWEVTTSGSGYVIKAKGEDKYITLNGGVVGNSQTVLNLHAGSGGTKNVLITIDGTYSHVSWEVVGDFFGWPVYDYVYSDRNYYQKALDWQSGFTASSNTSEQPYAWWGNPHTNYISASSTNVQFAKLSEDSEVVNENWPNNTYNEDQLEAWLEQALNEAPLQDPQKIGYVYDYDNRIYEIDLSVKSGVLALANDMSLAFVTDVSNSMLFPSSLTKYSKSGVSTEKINLTQSNLNSICNENSNLQTGKNVFFTVADVNGTSTVCALYRQNGTWYAMDASYYSRWQAGITDVMDKTGAVTYNYNYVDNRQIIINDSGSTALHKNDSSANPQKTGTTVKSGVTYTIYTANSEYFTAIQHGQIYDMSDNGAYGLQDNGTVTSYNMGNRLYYLENSVASAVNDLKTIAAQYPLGAVYAGLETFADKIWDTTDGYLQIGGISNNMTAANAAYKANYTTLYNMLKNIKGMDGTDQQEALQGVPGIGTLPSGTKKYVVLITDGAPNGPSKQDVIDAANALKTNGYTVITIGLSTKDVAVAPEMLWKSASFVDSSVPIDSTDKNKAKYYYYAENGEDLTWILREIVRTLMKEANITSTITDEIQKTFYPVGKDGTPLQQGDWINLDGEKVPSNSSSRAGQISYNSTSGTWSVTWRNQDTPWSRWNGTVFVKAKEDFMGGNNVSTNAGVDFIPESYGVNGKTATFSAAAKAEKTVHADTPYVNVDELHMTENHTEWTVYLGTEVDPAEQLKELFEGIDVNTVVKDNCVKSDYTMNGNQTYYTVAASTEDKQSPADGTNETIPLSHYISSEVLMNAATGLLARLKDGNEAGTVTSDPILYDPYGQGEVGHFYVTITKTVNEEAKASAPEAHVTEAAGDGVETYTMTVSYVPKSESQRETWLIANGLVTAGDADYQHHGDYGMAKEATESTSGNSHVINVFAKKLKLFKVDQEQNTITGDDAEFVLYRKATNEELNDSTVEKKTLAGLTGSYVAAQTLTTVNGVVTTDPLGLLKGTENYDEPYYLVETKAPDGYYILTEPLKVVIDMSETSALDHNTWGRFTPVTTYAAGETYYVLDTGTYEYVEATSITSQTDITNSEVTVYKFLPYSSSHTKPSPYALSDWQQEATIKITALNGSASSSAIRVIPDGQHGITYDSENDTTDASVQYKIINNAGVTLPSTGGPGTRLFTILGSILILGSGVLLWRKRRLI